MNTPVNHSNRSCEGGRREGSKYPALTVLLWTRRAPRVSLLLCFLGYVRYEGDDPWMVMAVAGGMIIVDLSFCRYFSC